MSTEKYIDILFISKSNIQCLLRRKRTASFLKDVKMKEGTMEYTPEGPYLTFIIEKIL